MTGKSAVMKGFFLALVLAIVLLAMACVSYTSRLPLAEQLLAQETPQADRELASLRRGRAIAVTECTSCHRFFWPDEYPPQAWRWIIRKMAARASLSESQANDVLQYFTAASRATRVSPRSL